MSMEPRPIAEAPVDDRWYLVCDPTLKHWQPAPWTFATRSDGGSGWCDDAGNDVDPVSFLPLPDPRPAGTGWTPPVGEIVVEKGQWKRTDTGEPLPGAAYTISVRRPDGSCDDYGWREPNYAATAEAAIEKARKLQQRIGLPIVDETSCVLPFRLRDARSHPSDGPEAA